MLLDVRPDQLQTVQAILRKHVSQHEVWAFGSRAKWTAKDYSDLDLCIVSDQPLSFKTLGLLKEAFAESDLPWKVDVVDWATTSDSFRKIIERDKVVVQMKEGGNPGLPCISEIIGWPTRKLGDVVSHQKGYPFKSSEYRPAGCPIIRVSNLTDRSVDMTGCSFIDNAVAHQYSTVSLSLLDVIVTTVGSWPSNPASVVGKVISVPACAHGTLLNQNAVRLRSKPEINQRFLFYLLKSQRFLSYIVGKAQGSASQASITLNDLFDFEFECPPMPEQDAIARVLSQIDNKVETNQNQSDLMAAIGREVFVSWFVDFDPVRAKAEGRPPFGLDEKTAALFPDGFEDSNLGDIPAGWLATTLADIVTERTGKVGPGNGHVILSAVASGELKHSDEHFTKQVYSQDTSKYKRVEQWDYAYNPSRINIGSIGMLEEPIVGAVSPVYTVLRPMQGYEWFLRFFLDLPQTKAVINQFCSGSVRQSLSFRDFAAIPVVLPPKAVAEAFSRRWQELNTLRRQLDVQSRQLSEVRDTLLPKLMSGELRVPETLMA